MSGICGICRPGALLSRADVEPMLAALMLPQEAGHDHVAGPSLTLGVARRWPSQGIASIPGVRLATDGDPCNLFDLRAEVSRQGIDASQLSVAEVLAWLYKFRGREFLLQLQGGFSLAIWDETVQRLLLAIDRFGIHGLYWCQEDDRLTFATRAGGVRAAQNRPSVISPGSIVQFLLFHAVPAPLTIYQDMFKLEPGFLLVYERGQVRHERYWDMDYAEDRSRSLDDWARELRESIRTAVHAHMRGCAPERTGAYLSGGTDSSSVVAFMSEVHSPVQTFSMFFEDPRYSEVEFARTTAERFGTSYHAKSISPQEAFDCIPRITEYYDEPFANSSAIAAYYCALTARERGVDTMLAGDGGDELFAGNERYASDKYFQLYDQVPRWLRRGLIEPFAGLLPEYGKLSLPRRYLRRAAISNPRRGLSYNFFLDRNPEDVFVPEFLAQVGEDNWLRIPEKHFWDAPRAASELNRSLYLDVKMTLADNDLRKVLGTAELAGVRTRFPLLDPGLAQLSGRIPSELKLKRFQKRYIFKQAMKEILPGKVLYKKKHGFGVPMGTWLLEHRPFRALMQDVVCDRGTHLRDYFRRTFLDRLPMLHQEHASYYGEVVWSLLMLELWHRREDRGIRELAHAE